MAEVALIAAAAAGAGASIFKGWNAKGEGEEANKIAGINAGNLRMEGDTAYRIGEYNAGVQRMEGKTARDIARYNALLTKHDGDAAKASAEFQAMQLDRGANEELAAGYMGAREKRGELDRVVSTQRARAAGSGAGGMETEGVLALVGKTMERGEYLAQLESFGGKTRAAGKMDQAAAARASGEAAQLRAHAAAHGINLEAESAFAHGENAASLSMLQADAMRKKLYSQAKVQEMEGKSRKRQGNNNFIGSILEGVGSFGKVAAGMIPTGGGGGGGDPWNTTVTRPARTRYS